MTGVNMSRRFAGVTIVMSVFARRILYCPLDSTIAYFVLFVCTI